MNSFVFNPRTKAFTLVELLVVIAIIGILAALLLPALNGGQRRAQRIFCENSLREIGIAFHVFSNDHTGKFPMDVSTNDGGSMEFVQNGFSAGQIFFTSFHTFQVLSNELVKPQILICPSDVMRGSASNFPVLQNQNLSYLFGANGTFDQPTSILAGDRNAANGVYPNPTVLPIGHQTGALVQGNPLFSWTWEMHQFQGNMLFSDGHVEEWNQSGMKSANAQISPIEYLFKPSVVEVANASPPGSGSGSDNGGSSGNSGNPGNGGSSGNVANPGNGANSGPAIQPTTYQPSAAIPMQPMTPMSSGSPNQTPPASGDTHESMSGPVSTASASQSSSETATEAAATASNATVAAAVPGDAGVMMSPFDQHLTKTLQHTFEWLYLLLLLLLLLYLAYRLRKWMREREAKLKARRLR
jgi:prepilin-type N-terminal cleavage/methylation domain-containing protein/prepilin-type processing-associated H-X9-DG protein